MSRPFTLELEIELLTDVSLSTSNRTLGPAGTSQCLPGRSLWGAAASAAYRAGMEEEEAFRLFHQGQVRFFDAVPMDGEARTYPTPRALHAPKDAPASEAWNFALEEVRVRWRDTQCKPLGEGWMSPQGRRVQVETVYTLRTSIDPSGRAREGFLFGLSALRAGARFWTALQGPQADVERVAALMTGPAGLRLGRSRNAELGRVRVTRRGRPAARLAEATGSARRISFLCVSRCLFRDPLTGAPALAPGPEAFGLDPAAWTFDEASSFVRTARISHFHSTRRRPETERLAVERGSVLTFQGQGAPVDLGALAAGWAEGVGEHRGQGYGEVLAAPAWLCEPSTRLLEAAARALRPAAEPDDELFRWASRAARSRGLAVDLHRQAEEAAATLRRFRVPPSQWGELRARGRAARFLGQGGAALKGEIEAWLDSGRRNLSPQWRAARGALLAACTDHLAELPMFLELLAGACLRPEAKEDR